MSKRSASRPCCLRHCCLRRLRAKIDHRAEEAFEDHQGTPSKMFQDWVGSIGIFILAITCNFTIGGLSWLGTDLAYQHTCDDRVTSAASSTPQKPQSSKGTRLRQVKSFVFLGNCKLPAPESELLALAAQYLDALEYSSISCTHLLRYAQTTI